MVLTKIIKSLRNYWLKWKYMLTQGTHVHGQNPLAKVYTIPTWLSSETLLLKKARSEHFGEERTAPRPM